MAQFTNTCKLWGVEAFWFTTMHYLDRCTRAKIQMATGFLGKMSVGVNLSFNTMVI